jgi:hypothetical protein
MKHLLFVPFLLTFLSAQIATGGTPVNPDAVVIKVTSEILSIPPREL